MAFFQRTKEAPMEFEYQYQPYPYSAFDPPLKDQEMIDRSLYEPIAPPPGDPLPQSSTTATNTKDVDDVSMHFGGIKLSDQQQRQRKERSVEHREIQTDDLLTSSQDTLLSTPPATPPDISTAPTISNTNTSTANNPDNNKDHEDVPMSLDEERQRHSASTPTSQQQHLHQHIYPSTHNPDYSYREHVLYVASSLIRIGCDIAWFTMAVYVGIQFALALKRDVNLKLETFESDRLDEFLNCQMEYANNRCDPSTRVPAMDELCRQWQQCLYRPMWIGTTRAVAETLADIINGFVDKISLRTMFFILTIVLLTLWARTYTPTVSAITATAPSSLSSSSKHSHHQLQYHPYHHNEPVGYLPPLPTQEETKQITF
ncbi:Di-sulfide bridge nucleocytoplasmic transport domain-containing protein [Zychaea mexicana]|uniref:Di-sulfide bridge nucleocytoplasmic transport domain-containing protein n=1 Tax=Zychaea mexicana TaxID=64656 RepID=UPI0022FE38D2|nr:Di-sulfide bridge nucleocytoplasmic transport domain-containing protein [Zychaea mexicana]KAI9488726.1 Di-sulfide bridge nucleocytoplasmic transport domain-containing protein [Zychaea mexicana]